MIPTRRLMWIVGVVALFALLDLVLRIVASAGSASWAMDVWRVAMLMLVLASMFDVISSRRLPQLSIRRGMPTNLAQGQWQTVELTIQGELTRPVALELYDLVPEGIEFKALPLALTLAPGQVVQASYELRPVARGDFHLGHTQLRWQSRLRLWQFQLNHPNSTTLHVFPDFSWLKRYLVLATDQRVGAMGVRLQQRRGEGLEFQELRDFRAGDMLRQVDWKATSRRDELISREYQEERDQQILFVLDTGRRMRAMDQGESHFDHVLRAMLLLAYVALRQGDAVGLLTFGQATRFMSMQRSTSAVNRLLRTVYDLEPGTAASDYLSLAAEVHRRQRRRALLVLLTNAKEEDEDLAQALTLLSKRHVVLVTSLREQTLDRAQNMELQTVDDALLLHGTSAQLLARRRLAEDVQRAGHRILDTVPDQLPVRLINDYWRLKRSGRL